MEQRETGRAARSTRLGLRGRGVELEPARDTGRAKEAEERQCIVTWPLRKQ